MASVKDFASTVMLFLMVSTSVDSIAQFRQMSWLLTGLIAVIALHGIKQVASEGGVGWTGARMIEGRITVVGY